MLSCNHQKDKSKKIKEFNINETEQQTIIIKKFGDLNNRGDLLKGSNDKDELK